VHEHRDLLLRPDLLRHLRRELLPGLRAREHDVTLRAGELAAAAGVNRETLRYYERRGLLARPDRSPGGHRLYPPDALVRLRVVKAAQRLGFTLDEIADLLRVGRSRGRDVGLQVRAREKLVEVEQRMADLGTIRDNLAAALAMGCEDLHECATQDCCPVPFLELATS
jgi:DNA-binding transcriptional MerR regulator